MSKLKRGRKHTNVWYQNLKDLIAKELEDNPYTKFSYYSLTKHITQEYRPVGSYCIQIRVGKLVEEGKVEVSVDPDKKSRKIIRWVGDK